MRALDPLEPFHRDPAREAPPWPARTAVREASAGVPAWSPVPAHQSLGHRTPLPTGLLALDAMLDGGFPRGRLSEVVGPRTSGRTSLILASLAQVTAAGGLAALVDMTDGLDPASARALGVELGRLLWVRCGGRLRPGLAAADAILRGGGFEAVVVDLGELPQGELGRVAPAALVRLQRAVEGTPAALLFTGAQRVGGSLTSVAVAVTPGSVTWQPGGPGLFGGLVTEARLVRARGRPPGASVRLVWSVGRGWH